MPEIEITQSSVSSRRKLFSLAINAALLIVSIVIVALPAEFIFRHRYGHMLYNPRPEVLAVQQYLTLDPKIGFKWQPEISADRGIRFNINDMTTPPLSTDSFGVMNSPAAIAQFAAGAECDVFGLGDSFMEMAAPRLHERFAQAGRSYYSLAIHRQCPVQYTAILNTWALPMKPRVVIYGIFENDFQESLDFERWKTSGLDWFTYHSGTWCGPPIGDGAFERFTRNYTRGWYTFARVLNEKLRGPQSNSRAVTEHEIDLATRPIAEAAKNAENSGARFVLVIIPSKEAAQGATTAESLAYDKVLTALQPVDFEVVDLRKPFHEHPDPASLYYLKDGHWYENGIALAADIILKQLESKPNES